MSHDNSFTTKSRKERVIPMNNTLFNLLVSLPRNGDYVFVNQSGNQRDDAKLAKLFKQYVQKAELDYSFSFHTLRHTFASHLVQKGVSLYIVSKLLGHSEIKTTEIYAHLAPGTFLDVVRLLDDGEERMQLGVR